MSQSASVTITDPTGLHARPAVKLTRLAKQFESTVQIRAADDADWVNAKSPNAVMKLKARHGAQLQIRAEGRDESEAVSALVTLLEDEGGG